MGWFSERIAALRWAKAHRAWLYSAGISILAAAGVEFWPQIRNQLAKWDGIIAFSEAEGTTLFGHPAWTIFILLGLIFLCIWLFESVAKAHKELSPQIEASFDPNSGGLSITTLTNSDTGEFVDDVKYVRVAAYCAYQKSVQESVANLVKIERRLDRRRTETVWDQDALPLRWSVTGEIETKVHYRTKRFIDVAGVSRKSGRLEFLTIVPNRLAPELQKHGTFLITVVVTGNSVSREVVFEVDSDGTFDGLKARAL
jgi:hypothetical protein